VGCATAYERRKKVFSCVRAVVGDWNDCLIALLDVWRIVCYSALDKAAIAASIFDKLYLSFLGNRDIVCRRGKE
jgi:hypothetical protein